MASAQDNLQQFIGEENQAGLVDVKFCVAVSAGKVTAEAASKNALEILNADKEGKTREYSDY